MNQDIEITCKDCGTIFTFSAAEQEFYAEHNFDQPKRCSPCRKARKANNQKSN
jgi:hypothetical protein